jgi:hypothetical protein
MAAHDRVCRARRSDASSFMQDLTGAGTSFLEALDPKTVAAYDRRATGRKTLINPHKAG